MTGATDTPAQPQARVPAAALQQFAASLLQAAGLAPAHALQVAEVLAWADLRGAPSHGVSRLPLYLRWLDSGEMQRNAQVRTVLQLPALAVLDGGHGPGAVGMMQAVTQATTLARASGVGLVLLRDTTHTGALGFYTSALARQGLLGMAMVASGPHMAYHGAAVAGVSTAPLSIAAPRGAGLPPVVFDMASSVAALGKLMQARQAGGTIPPGWAMDAHGLPTTDPAQAAVPLPLGGPKGAGLALMMEIMTSVVLGNPILSAALAAGASPQPHFQNALLLALDIAQIKLGGSDSDSVAERAGDNVGASVGGNGNEGYIDAIEALLSQIKALPAAPGAEVLLPGERGARAAADNAAQGIALAAGVRQELAQAATRFGVATPW